MRFHKNCSAQLTHVLAFLTHHEHAYMVEQCGQLEFPTRFQWSPYRCAAIALDLALLARLTRHAQWAFSLARGPALAPVVRFIRTGAFVGAPVVIVIRGVMAELRSSAGARDMLLRGAVDICCVHCAGSDGGVLGGRGSVVS